VKDEGRPIIDPPTRLSPRTRARITGGVYLFFFVTSILGEVFFAQAGISGVRPTPNDASLAATGILSHEAAYRAGVAIALISTASYAALIGLFYRLFRPAGAALALVATILGLIGCAVSAGGAVFHFAPLLVLKGDAYLGAFDPGQLAALALLALKLGAQVNTIALVFFGLFQIAIGYVMFQATFLPKILGVLILVAGVGWLTVLVPPVVNALGTPLEILGFIAEATLMVWLLAFGVNTQRWNEQAERASS
jgi:uncharacterized protein DUF4386